jgi:hypothetical protein
MSDWRQQIDERLQRQEDEFEKRRREDIARVAKEHGFICCWCNSPTQNYGYQLHGRLFWPKDMMRCVQCNHYVHLEKVSSECNYKGFCRHCG